MAEQLRSVILVKTRASIDIFAAEIIPATVVEE